MHVKAVASTVVDYDALEESGYVSQEDYNGLAPEPFAPNEEWEAYSERAYPTAIDELHEAAGRGCYQSWNRPNPKTATNAGYLGNIIDVQHESVLGHGHVTFYVSGVSRALLLELERHQQHMNLNFSVVSQRYVDHGLNSGAQVVMPPLFDEDLQFELAEQMRDAQANYDNAVEKLMEKGYSRKEARGAARAFLPEATETKFFVTGSIRAWRDIIRKRLTDGADIEIRLFAIAVLKELVRVAPNSVQDFTEMHATELGDS